MATFHSVLLVVCFLFAFPLQAAVNEPPSDNEATAAAHFRRAIELVDVGQYEPALQEFQAAYDTSPRYQVLYNIGLVLRLLGRHGQSRQTFARYLREGGENIVAQRRAEVAGLMADSEAASRLGPNATGPPKSTGETPSPSPAAAANSVVPAPWLVATETDSLPAVSRPGPKVVERPSGGGHRIAKPLAAASAAMGAGAIALYFWNHHRWQKWNDEDGALSMAAPPADEPARAMLVRRQMENNDLIDSVHLFDRITLGLGVTAGIGGLTALWFWSRSENPPPVTIGTTGSSPVSIAWSGRF